MEEVRSERYPELKVIGEVEDMESLRRGDPSLYRAVQDVIAALHNDMLPMQVQHALVGAMSASTKRDVVAQIAGLDASILMTFKQQLQLVDAVLRRVVTPDGSKSSTADEMDVSVKDALNMSLRVTQVLVRDLPKIYKLEQIQKQERALHMLLDRHMSREHQDKYLELLEQIEKELADEGA